MASIIKAINISLYRFSSELSLGKTKSRAGNASAYKAMKVSHI